MGFDRTTGDGLAVVLNSATPTQGQLLQARGDGTFYFADSATAAGGNIYNSDGTIGASVGREVTMDTDASIQFGNMSGANDRYFLYSTTDPGALEVHNADGSYLELSGGLDIGWVSSSSPSLYLHDETEENYIQQTK